MSKLGTRLIKSARQARAYAKGEATNGFVAHVPDDVDVKALRKQLGFSQAQFSRRFGFAIDGCRIGNSIGDGRTAPRAFC
jgi:putative transcriptional regulator